MNRKFTVRTALLMACCVAAMLSKAHAQPNEARTFDGQGGPNVGNTTETAGSSNTPADTPEMAARYVDRHSHFSPFSLTGTVYSGLPYIKDDNPAGFTQTYVRANINRWYKNPYSEFTLFRNFYLEGYFSTNAGNLPVFYDASPKPISFVNRLDLYEHANVRLNMHENLFYIHPHEHSSWRTSLYVDLMQSYMRTNVSDSIANNTFNVDSWLLGANATLYMSDYKNFANLPVIIRLTGEVFWVNALTNSVNTDLNFQYANKADYTNPLNAGRSMTINPSPYYKIDAQVQFQISKKNAKDSTNNASAINGDNTSPQNYVFVHVGYVSNFIGSDTKDFYNTYLSAQIGVSIDIVGSIKKYTGSGTSGG